jgi:hypothetical protein
VSMRATNLRWYGTNSRRYSLWGKEILSEEPVVHYDQIMADESGVGEWTAKIVYFPDSLERDIHSNFKRESTVSAM